MKEYVAGGCFIQQNLCLKLQGKGRVGNGGETIKVLRDKS
jgi:hypothetical protein